MSFSWLWQSNRGPDQVCSYGKQAVAKNHEIVDSLKKCPWSGRAAPLHGWFGQSTGSERLVTAGQLRAHFVDVFFLIGLTAAESNPSDVR